ncbi:MAG: hypothetical protein QM601_08625 [Pseudoxanthomonas sp.]
MLAALLLLVAMLLTLELVRRLPLLRSFAVLGRGGRRAGRLLRSRASDYSKERASGLLARHLLHASGRAGGLLLLAVSPLLLLLLADHWAGWGVLHALGDVRTRVVVFVVLLGYGLGRRFLRR